MITEAKINKQFDEFDVFLDNIFFEQTETELTVEKRKERRALADKSDFDFCKIYFPQIFTDNWNQLHIKIEAAKKGIFTISGSRYFGKSAFTFITKIIKPMAIGGIGLIGLGMSTQKHAAVRAGKLVSLLERNKKLCYDYDINIQSKSSTDGDYTINHKNFVTFGAREGLRNFSDEEFNRFETIVLDDLFDGISVRSDKSNDRIYDFVTVECKDQMKPKDGLLIWLFNYVADNSPGKRYAEEFPDRHFNLPALNEAGETNWPESSYWTTEELERWKNDMTYDVWMGSWMNDPIQKGDIMDKDWLNFVRVNYGQIIATITAIDPSHGQSPSACDKGMCTLALLKDGTYDILDLYSRKEDWSRVFDYIYEMKSRFPKWKVLLFENDFSQWDYAGAYYTRWVEDNKKHLPIVLFDSKNNKTPFYGSDKESRCMNLVFPFQKGKIRINEDVKGSAAYKIWEKSYISFGKGKIADVHDATASAFIMIGRYVNMGSFRSLGWRTTKEKLFRIVQ